MNTHEQRYLAIRAFSLLPTEQAEALHEKHWPADRPEPTTEEEFDAGIDLLVEALRES
jgi:hypothetical protein